MFLCFQLASLTLIVYLVTIGVLLPPIVIFSLLLCGLASFDSNLFVLCWFFAFRFLPFCFFAFAIMCLPKTISLQVGRKLADKTKDEILTEVLRVFAGLDVKAVQIAYEVVRVTFASPEHFRAAKSFSGKHLFGLWCSILGGGPPVTRVHVFDFPFEEDDRSLGVAFEAYGAVKSVKKQTFLSNQNIFNGTRLVDVVLSGVLPRFLMVDGYLCRLWYRGQPLVCNLCAVQGHRSANCPNKDKCRKCGQSGHFARNCTSDGSAGDSADFPPLASSPQSAEANVSQDSSDSQLLKDNELDLMQSQSILQDLVPVSGESSGESNQRASKRAGKDKGSSAKRSNSTSNICFTNSQEFASLLANSELENNENAAVRNEQLNVSNENISVNSTGRLNEVINNSSADSTVNEVINNSSTEREVINNNTERSSEVINNSSTERSNEVNDITVNESNVVVVENVAEMESVDVAATSGRPLIEVIDEGQADLSSDEIESFGDSSSSSSLPPIFSEPPPDFADAMDESDSPPKDTSSPPSVGSRYEGRSLCAKAKGSRGAASVRQSPLLKPLSGKHVLPQVVSSKPKGLRRSASLEELVL